MASKDALDGRVWCSVDVVRRSAAAGRVVVWEESARDGAQAKTLMTPESRVRPARETGRVFGADGPRHVVFAAGFPAVCGEEFEAVRRVAVEAEGAVGVATVCRGARPDVEQALVSVRGSRHARVMVVVPASDAMAHAMVHRTAAEALQTGVGLVKQARDQDDAGGGRRVPERTPPVPMPPSWPASPGPRRTRARA
ncbi:hypothetical protein [Streptomyces sp. NPDC006309]|uniref:hypothetical protein n=1 Tax=Streptomyces sp. NPDC006309 TaxID=3156749 RepID=UPI0033BBC8D7